MPESLSKFSKYFPLKKGNKHLSLRTNAEVLQFDNAGIVNGQHLACDLPPPPAL